MKKVLDVVIPVYGKDPKITFQNIKEMKDMNLSDMNFYVIYKNGNELSYDDLLKLKGDNFFVEKAESSFLRTQKVLKGVSMAESKYILTIDSHHSLNKKNVLSAISELRRIDADLILMKPIELNVDNNSKRSRKIKAFTAGRYIVRRELISDIQDAIDFDVVFHDDWTLGLYASLRKSDLKINWINSKFYIKRHGKMLSNTFNNRNIENIKRMINDGGAILNYFLDRISIEDLKDMDREALNQLYDLYKGMMRRFSWIDRRKIFYTKPERKVQWLEELFKDNIEEKAKLIYEIKNIVINRFYIEDYVAIRKKDINFIEENLR